MEQHLHFHSNKQKVPKSYKLI